MPGIATVLTDAAELGLDINRSNKSSHTPVDISVDLVERHAELAAEKAQIEAQMKEVEKFHQQVVGKPIKQAAARQPYWAWLTL